MSKTDVSQRIPTYRASGEQRRDYSPEALEKLEAAGRVLIERDEQGRMIAAQFKPKPDPKPTVRLSIPTGTYYSFEEFVGSGYYAWAHKDLSRDAAELVGREAAEVDAFLQRIFRSVPLSCMASTEAAGAAAQTADAVRLGPHKRKLAIEERREARKRRKKAERLARKQRSEEARTKKATANR